MIMKQAFLGALSLVASVAASATTLDLGRYTLTYDETTVFGDPTLITSGPGNAVTSAGRWAAQSIISMSVPAPILPRCKKLSFSPAIALRLRPASL